MSYLLIEHYIKSLKYIKSFRFAKLNQKVISLICTMNVMSDLGRKKITMEKSKEASCTSKEAGYSSLKFKTTIT